MVDAVLAEVAYEQCMGKLKEKDHDLKLTGKCKKSYDYLAEQFILNYIKGASVSYLMDSLDSGKFYNTWLGFLGAVKCIIRDGGTRWELLKGYESIINASGISRKNLMKFLDYYFQER